MAEPTLIRPLCDDPLAIEDPEVLAWNNCHSDDLWIFDKLLLSKKFNYLCGPGCVPVPAANFYIVRPVMNLYGMGAGAERKWLTPADSAAVPPGYFWCEEFSGRHLSVDYDRNGVQLNCVEGFRRANAPLYKFSEWKVVHQIIQFPEVLKSLAGSYNFYNVETIDDKIIEVHLRHNQDPIDHNLQVCWENDQPRENLRFLPYHEDADGYLPEKRLGFYVANNKSMCGTNGGQTTREAPINGNSAFIECARVQAAHPAWPSRRARIPR
jgi:hypothetical protein